jgi:VanZ family protein
VRGRARYAHPAPARPSPSPVLEEALSRRPPERSAYTLFIRYWLPVLAYITLIFSLSATPYLKPPIQFPVLSDKIYHVGEYGVFGLLLARGLRASLRVSMPIVVALITLALGIAIGAADESFQRFIPGRDSSVYDLLADTIGVALAQVVYLIFVRE